MKPFNRFQFHFRRSAVGAILTATLYLIGCETPQSPQTIDALPDPISECGSIRVLSPNGGNSFTIGDTVPIRWEANPDSILSAVLEISFDAGKTWSTIAGNRTIHPFDPDWGNYSWVISDSLLDWATGNTVPVVSSTECLVHIWDYAKNYLVDGSDEFFTIRLH